MNIHVHYWLLPPHGATVLAVCRDCGDDRTFGNLAYEATVTGGPWGSREKGADAARIRKAREKWNTLVTKPKHVRVLPL